MPPKPSPHYSIAAQPAARPDSSAAIDDFDDGFPVYVLTVFLGLYLLITVLLLRGGYFLGRQLPRRKRPGPAPARKPLGLDAARLD